MNHVDLPVSTISTTPHIDAAPAPAESVNEIKRRVAKVAMAVTAAALVLGLVLRLWYLFHVPTTSDEAIVGLMANDILHGHFSAFYWGQAYGGGEAYVVAVMFAVFGHSAVVLGLSAVVLSATAAILTWRAARRLVSSPELAALTGALVWLVPDAAISNSTREGGFRGVTMVCGLACLLLALRLLDGSRSWFDACAIGLFAGLGWWSSPEIAYFLVPAGLVTAGAVAKSKIPMRSWVARAVAALAAFVVGALPWIWANTNSGFASLRLSSFPGGATTSFNNGFWGRLGVFGRLSMPIELNLRRLPTGMFLFGGTGAGFRHALGVTVTVAAITIAGLATMLCAVRGGRWLALALSVAAFPFLFAAQPGTWFWADGRYIVFLGPLLALSVVSGIEEAVHLLSARRSWSHSFSVSIAALIVSGVLTAGIVLSVFAIAGDNQASVGTLTSGWGDPDGPVSTAVASLRMAGVHDGFADYWVAYKLDFLSDRGMTFTTARGDVDRHKAFDHVVEGESAQAWIFVPPSELDIGYRQFSPTAMIAGPDGIAEAHFLAVLRALGVPFRVVNAGIVSAVIPQRKVTISETMATVP
jgi:hypothetical protein